MVGLLARQAESGEEAYCVGACAAGENVVVKQQFFAKLCGLTFYFHPNHQPFSAHLFMAGIF